MADKRIRYASIKIEVSPEYLTGHGEEPESEGWDLIQANLSKHLDGFSRFPALMPTASFTRWDDEFLHAKPRRYCVACHSGIVRGPHVTFCQRCDEIRP